MKRNWSLLILGIALLGGGLLTGTMSDQQYQGGSFTVIVVNEVPSEVTIIEANTSSVTESSLLMREVKAANKSQKSRTPLPSQESYEAVTSALPEEAYYEGENAKAGYYIRYGGRVIRINTLQLA